MESFFGLWQALDERQPHDVGEQRDSVAPTDLERYRSSKEVKDSRSHAYKERSTAATRVSNTVSYSQCIH